VEEVVVKRWIICLCFFGTLVLVTPAFGQQGHINESLGKLEMAKHPLELEAPTGPQAQKLDAEKIRGEADELAKLANSMPSDIAQILQGKLPKDTADKLKRIEKLSKHLRGELNP
jgi:hypothetical protein